MQVFYKKHSMNSESLKWKNISKGKETKFRQMWCLNIRPDKYLTKMQFFFVFSEKVVVMEASYGSPFVLKKKQSSFLLLTYSTWRRK